MSLENFCAQKDEDCELIIRKAKKLGLRLKLIGGWAVHYTSPLPYESGTLSREYKDIDLIGLSKEKKGIYGVLKDCGYEPDVRFNSAHGDTRLVFRKGTKEVDVFLDKFEMCHSLDMRKRLDIDYPSISVDDLLFTKLQVVEITEKDIRDLARLFLTHEVRRAGEAPHDLHLDYFGAMCSDDWGIYKTLSINLDNTKTHLGEMGLDSGKVLLITSRIDSIRDHIERVKKSTRWKLRAAIGGRIRWYLLPEEKVGKG